MHRPTSRTISRTLAAFVSVAATACTQLTVQTKTVPQAVADGSNSELSFTMPDGRVVPISRPQVVGDSVIGTAPGSAARVAVSVSDVRMVSKQGISTTGAILIGSALTIVILIGLLFLALGALHPIA